MRFLIFAILVVIVILSLRSFVRASPKKIADKLRSLIIIIPVATAAIFVFLGKFLFSLPFLILILPLLKIKGGLSLYQMFFLFRLLQRLKASGRFRFGETGAVKSSSMSVAEAYKILNLDPKKKYTKDEVLNSYKKIMKKIHPDISPELTRLASIVNEAKDKIIKDITSKINLIMLAPFQELHQLQFYLGRFLSHV